MRKNLLRKNATLILIFVILVSVFQSCGQEEHVHDFDMWKDCGTYQSRICKECGFTEKELFGNNSTFESDVTHDNDTSEPQEDLPDSIAFYKAYSDYFFDCLQYCNDKSINIDLNKDISACLSAAQNIKKNGNVTIDGYPFSMLSDTSEDFLNELSKEIKNASIEGDTYWDAVCMWGISQAEIADYFYQNDKVLNKIYKMWGSLCQSLSDATEHWNVDYGFKPENDGEWRHLIIYFANLVDKYKTHYLNDNSFIMLSNAVQSLNDAGFLLDLSDYNYLLTRVTYTWLGESYYLDISLTKYGDEYEKKYSSNVKNASVSFDYYTEYANNVKSVSDINVENGQYTGYKTLQYSDYKEVWRIVYDSNGRVISENLFSSTQKNVFGRACDGYEYKYDANGNRIMKIVYSDFNNRKIHSQYKMEYISTIDYMESSLK